MKWLTQKEGILGLCLKRKLKSCRIVGVRFHEIIAVTEMGKDKAAQKPRTIFFLSKSKKKIYKKMTYMSGP